MILAGGGMVIGNLLGGKFSDKYSPSLVAGYTQLVACISLTLIFFCAKNPILSVILMCICTACLFAVSAPQQLLLIKNAKGEKYLSLMFSNFI